MDKGKSTAATSSEAMWVSAKELFGIESDSDEERRPATSSKAPAAARGVHEGASSSATGTGAVVASSSSAPAETQEVAPFQDGQFVRLRNRGRGGYLFANGDGRGVSIDHRRHMVNTAWAVQVLAARVLLRGAYGRYLSATGSAARSGHIGGYVAQCILEFPDDHHIEWSVTRGKRGGVVLLRATDGGPCALRANGRYLRWNKGVTYGCVNLNISSMLEWEVQVIPLTAERPPYQPRPPNAAIINILYICCPELQIPSHFRSLLNIWLTELCNPNSEQLVVEMFADETTASRLRRWPEGCLELVTIIFSHAWFGDNGRIEHGHWTQMRFDGRSLTELGNEIANRLGVQFENVTLCVQAGDLGRPVPLLTDLPLRDDPTIILAFMVDSPGYNALRFPDLAAE